VPERARILRDKDNKTGEIAAALTISDAPCIAVAHYTKPERKRTKDGVIYEVTLTVSDDFQRCEAVVRTKPKARLWEPWVNVVNKFVWSRGAAT